MRFHQKLLACMEAHYLFCCLHKRLRKILPDTLDQGSQRRIALERPIINSKRDQFGVFQRELCNQRHIRKQQSQEGQNTVTRCHQNSDFFRRIAEIKF